MTAGIKPLDHFITHEIGALNHHSTADVCPACASDMKAERKGRQYYSKARLPVMRKERYARDYVVRCCPRCGRCYYLDQKHGRLIELAFGYEDFFGGDER